ncbi:hypothetical protein [Alteromonas sp. S167]|jgi:hypothetical protein|uniref:hypothetical protein n=1 Tax=Alteromonas sp. S167 TaxID=3117402 RepID=UPI002FE0EBC7
MRRLNAFLLASVAGFLVAGCGASLSAYNGDSNDNTMHEATLEQLSLQDKQQIESLISNWYGGVKVTIASNAFVDASTVSIERKTHVDDRGLPIEGRHSNRALSFTLLKQGETCLLRNNQTGVTSALTSASCTY